MDKIYYLESMRSKPMDGGTWILKGPMEYAVAYAWDKATSTLGNPEDGVEIHDLSILANEIINFLVEHEVI